jgi:hypothetical protein
MNRRCVRAIAMVLLWAVLVSCKGTVAVEHATPDADERNDVETWALRPFYGELRFLILSEDDGKPIPDATLQVTNLPILERGDAQGSSSDLNGRLIIHQLERGTMYRGDGPPPPEFIFSAPGYATRSFTVADLVAGTDYDAYKSAALPTTTFHNEAGAEFELPVFEFTIHLLTESQGSRDPGVRRDRQR